MKFQSLPTKAFSALELAIVIAMFALLMLVVLPMLPPRHRPKSTGQRIQCINNLKQIGVAYRIWEGDNGDKVPALVPNLSSNGGWADFVKLTNAGAYCWSNYSVMPNELGQSPRILACPADDRNYAIDFKHLKNTNISYFFGTGGNDNFPQSILGGDRNLGPGTTPKGDFGFSPEDGRGNDVILLTNSPVCWSRKTHSEGGTNGSGHVLLGDGSVQQVSSARFRSDLQPNAVDAGNFPSGYINQSNSFRLIFP
jgi:competence protein ComGC